MVSPPTCLSAAPVAFVSASLSALQENGSGMVAELLPAEALIRRPGLYRLDHPQEKESLVTLLQASTHCCFLTEEGVRSPPSPDPRTSLLRATTPSTGEHEQRDEYPLFDLLEEAIRVLDD